MKFKVSKSRLSIFVTIAASFIFLTAYAEAQYGPDTCGPGYVWREARPGNHVCVTTETRKHVIADNNLAASRRLNATGAQENIGQTQQGLVSGQLVHPNTQEEYGLLTLGTPGRCSASLLTNEWVITAAHCLDSADINNPSQVTLTANWKSVQSRQGITIRSFGPAIDIALIRVRSPFSVHGYTSGYRRRLAWEEDYYRLTMFGRGIYALAQGSGPTATPAKRDGQYRFAPAQIKRLEQNLYWFGPNEFGQITAGGDSGGPSFSNMITGPVLVGVHSTCSFRCLPGQMCSSPSPWTWISNALECADAPVYPIGEEIAKTLGTPHPIRGTQIQGEAKNKPNPATTRSGDTVYGPLSPPGSTPSPDPGCTVKRPYKRCNAFGHCYCSDVRPPVVIN